MDDCFFNQSAVDAASLRIMEKRRKKRRIKAGYQKSMIRLEKQEKYWNERCWNTTYIPLKEPVQRGWRREFFLNDETARGKHAAFFEGIREAVNRVEYSNDKDFTRKMRKSGRKIRVHIPQYLKEIASCYWRRVTLSDAQRQMFTAITRINKRGEKVTSYAFNEPWRLVLRVRPNMLTHTKQVDTEAEKRSKELSNKIERCALRPAMNKARSRGTKYFWKKAPHFKNPAWRKTVTQCLDMINSEKIPDHYPPIETATRTIAGRFVFTRLLTGT